MGNTEAFSRSANQLHHERDHSIYQTEVNKQYGRQGHKVNRKYLRNFCGF